VHHPYSLSLLPSFTLPLPLAWPVFHSYPSLVSGVFPSVLYMHFASPQSCVVKQYSVCFLSPCSYTDMMYFIIIHYLSFLGVYWAKDDGDDRVVLKFCFLQPMWHFWDLGLSLCYYTSYVIMQYGATLSLSSSVKWESFWYVLNVFYCY
jgi:hypothetical protein